MNELQNNPLTKMPSGRFLPADKKTQKILKNNSVLDFLHYSNMLTDKAEREKIAKIISKYVLDVKRLNNLDAECN